MYGQIENEENVTLFQSAVDINSSDRNARNEFGELYTISAIYLMQ